MLKSDKSYLEIKVTFQHILILLIGVIIIGAFLFFLGYQAGESSEQKAEQTRLAKGEGKEIHFDEGDKQDPDKIPEVKEPSISEEIKLHRQPTTEKSNSQKQAKKIEKESRKKETEVQATKPATRESYFSVQVGAFNSHALAKKYSVKFSRAGYPTSISQANVKGKTWYRVRVGNYETRTEAKNEKRKLEQLENKKFTIVKQ